MKANIKELVTDKINLKSESEMVLSWRFVFPGNARIKIKDNSINLKIFEENNKVNKDLIKGLSSHIMESRPDCALVSGGIDSSLITAIAKKELGKIKLVSAGVNGSEDIIFSEKLADNINETLYTADITEKDVIYAIKELKRMNLDMYNIIMGITEVIAIKKAKEIGCKRIMSGLGSDELFFGFYRHKKMKAHELLDYREERLFYMPAFDLFRINSIAKHFKVSIILPYLTESVINTAKYGIKTEYNDKAMLRSAGTEVGLDKALTERKKKAMQYGSGVVKLLRKISAKKHKKVGELIKGI